MKPALYEVAYREYNSTTICSLTGSVIWSFVGKARTGDVRHCFCDTRLAAEQLGFEAQQDFGEGLGELAEWVAHQNAIDRVDEARAELEVRGLVA